MRIARPTESVPPYVPEPAPKGVEPSAVHPAPSPFWRVLGGMAKALDQGESLIQRSAQGGAPLAAMSPGALIALQAGIYRYTEVVAFVAKLL